MASYIYSLSADFPGGAINSSALEIAIRESSISTTLNGIGQSGDIVTIEFANTLSVADKLTLDGNQLGPAGGLISTTPTRLFIDNNVRNVVLGYFPQVNMQSTQDQPFFITTRPYIIKRIVAYNPSTSMSLALGGIYTQRNKGGTTYVTALQSYATLTDSGKYLELTLNPTLLANVETKQELFFSLTTGHLTPSTMDIIVYGDDMSGLI